MNVIFLGAPGAGKGTQAAVVAEKIKAAHVATGDLFRAALKQGTKLGLEAKGYMEKGQLVPDSVTINMVLEKLQQPECKNGAVLDGFPRNLEQARALDENLPKLKMKLDKVVYIKVSEPELLKRLSGRWICKDCQAPYHEIDAPPKAKGKCDKCGGVLYQRADDTIETIKKRLKVYEAETAPLIKYYTDSKRLVEVNGEGKMGEITQAILKALGKK